MSYSVGRGGFSLNASRIRQKQRIRVSLYLSGQNAKTFFHLLQRDKDAIEEELGCSLTWREMSKQCEIVSHLDNVDPNDESDWPRQHAWMAGQFSAFSAAFAPRVARLNPDELELSEE